jgi:protein TonB
VAAAPASPVQEEEKKPEEADIKAAEPPPPTPEPAENKIAETEQPPAPVTPPAPPEPVHDTAQQVASAAAEAQQEREAAERSLQARRATLASLYQGQIYSLVEHHKVNPGSRRTGRVVVELTIDPSGKLVSREVVQSSGSEVLDRAAVATLDKAAPFPPIPADLGSTPRTFRVPFEYATR